jgi:hypothetical protein
LPKAGQTGLNETVAVEEVAILFHLGGDDWAWADEAHLAGEDVPYLWQFVDTVATQKVSNGCNSRIVPELVGLVPLAAGLRVRVKILLQYLGGV